MMTIDVDDHQNQSINLLNNLNPSTSKQSMEFNLNNNNNNNNKTNSKFNNTKNAKTKENFCKKFFGRQQKKDRRAKNQEQMGRLLFGETQEEPCSSVLNKNQDDEMFITGYARSTCRTIFCWILIIATGGLLRLVMHWCQHWYLIATHSQCPLSRAEKILITEHFQGKHTVYYVKNVIELNRDVFKKLVTNPKSKINSLIPFEREKHENYPTGELELPLHYTDGTFHDVSSVRLFQCKQLRYVWHDDTQSFVKLMGLDHNVPSVLLHQLRGLSEDEQYRRRLIYGLNQITIPYKTVMTLLFLEILNPFYVFQIFSVGLWFSYDYYYYAAVIILMSAFGISLSVIQTRKNQQALYSTIISYETATVIRHDGSTSTIETKFLVPGDIIEIPSAGCTMQCDAVLLSGICILDESMLTGESVPVTKTALPCKNDVLFDIKEHARHMLNCGTKVIQTRYIGSEKVLAVIINTGNKTAKGGLIRSILYPPPVDYKFEQDSYKFIMLLGVAATVGFLYTLVTKILREVPGWKIAVEALDLITIAVPPALPAALSVGRMYAQKRLLNNNIYCISPRSINISGSIDCVCFDKTGTLTEDGLDMWGVVPKSSTNYFQIPLRDVERLPVDNLLFGMVTCHSLTKMNGELKGDPLDLKMFESTKWSLEEANVADDTKYDLIFPTYVKPNKLYDSAEIEANLEIGIVREFSFTSSLQRMSVITRKITDSHFNVYCKGSPEMIVTLCKRESIPLDFDTILDVYAQQGYRIIAIAHKSLDKKYSYAKIQRISRDKIECDLEFQGLVVLENRLKKDTTSVIQSLMSANIRTIMVTGDNILTALSVAKDCGMISKGQSIITVNHRMLSDGNYEIFYNLTGPPGRGFNGNKDHFIKATTSKPEITDTTPNGGCLVKDNNDGEYILMTNSNSIASLETIDTYTHTTNVITERPEDIELGSDMGEIKKKSFKNQFTNIFNQNNDEFNMFNEQPCNNYRLAMIGRTWNVLHEHFPELIPKIVTRGTVFARMAPDQKQSLIHELQNLGYYVAMCGDGANDCGALKAAHTGISLSDAESSVASPFTSKNPTIACVPNIIKEGRAALVTLFGIFKYMAAYSLVQFASVLILYSIDSNLTDFQYLYIDLFLISVFAFFFGKTESYSGTLVKQTPLNSLISISPVLSLVLHLTLALGFQIIGWYHLQAQSWFVPFVYESNDGKDELGCYENFTIFIISCFQYITLAVVFSKGAPYRKSIFSNYGFLISIISSTIFTIYIGIYPATFFVDLFDLVLPESMQFRIYLIIYSLLNFLISLFIEQFLIDFIIFKKLRYRFHNIHKSHRKFLLIENELRQNIKWPPISGYHSDNQIAINDKTSPSSYTEIGIEHDRNIPLDPNSTVLNSFFLDNLSESSENVNIVNNIEPIMESRNDSGIDQ